MRKAYSWRLLVARPLLLIMMLVFAASCSTSATRDSGAEESKSIPGNYTVKLKFIKRIKTDAQPKQVCLHPERNEFYVVNLNNGGGAVTKELGPGTLQIFSLDTFELLHEEPARTAVECMIVDRDRLLYSDMFRDEVVYFDLATRKVLTRSPIKPDTIRNFGGTEYRFMPKIIEPVSDSQALVTLWLGGMARIDFKKGELVKHFDKFCALPRGILPVPGSSDVYIMCYGIPHGPGEIVRLNPDTGKVTSRIRTGGSPRHVVALKDGTAYISNLNSGEIYHFDPAKGSFIHKMYMGGGINTIDVDPSGRFLFISQRELDLVSVIDASTWTVVLKQKVGDYPTGLDVSYDGKYMAVTNFHEASMDLFEIQYVPAEKSEQP
ncbi:MAG: hypothetical protein CMN76_10725 [Spirochaetaceae bacterium]|nr:hypothetical protein [Spirochaetaceae bacterium]